LNNDFKNKVKSNIASKKDTLPLNTNIKSTNEELILATKVNTNTSNAFTLGTKVESITKKKTISVVLGCRDTKRFGTYM